MKLKMWIGNYDGVRRGLIIAPTKKRALEVLQEHGRCGRTHFDDYWSLQADVDPALEPEVLYTTDNRNYPMPPWVKGRCEILPRK